MTRYLKAPFVLVVAIAAVAALPATAGAGCPGCEEYTLDIPEEEPEAAPAPVPGAAPAPVAPAAPATTTPTETTSPEPAVGVAEEVIAPEPTDPDDDPVPEEVTPAPISNVPAVAATKASDLESSSPGGVWPLAIAMVAVAIAGAALALGRRRNVREGPDTPRWASRGRS